MKKKTKIIFETNELKSLLVGKYFYDSGYQVKIKNRIKNFSFDDSFSFDGYTFDCGYHAVDIDRSKLYNDILDKLNIKWNISDGKRLLVFKDLILDRGYSFNKIEHLFQKKNKNIFKNKFLKKLENIYGSDFVRFSIDFLSKSYVQNRLWNKLNLDYTEILKNIYPWFFPNEKNDNMKMIHNHFHNKVDKKVFVRYPKSDGFISITKSLRDNLNKIIIGEKENYKIAKFDNHGNIIDCDSNSLHVAPIDYFEIASNFDLKLPYYESSYFYLVSVILDKPFFLKTNEILVADNKYHIDRISSTEKLSGIDNVRSLQFECENEINLSNESILKNILSFSRKVLKIKSFKNYDIKSVKIKRYDTKDITIKINNIINFIENKNPNFIVMNRHLNYENLSDGVPNLINRIKSKI